MERYFTTDTHFSHPLLTCIRGFYKDTQLGNTATKIYETEGWKATSEWIGNQPWNGGRMPMAEIADTEAHNKKLVENINSVVKEDDELWILGDVSYRTPMEDMQHWVKQLNGKKHMIIGNHDGPEGKFRKLLGENSEELLKPYLKVFETVKLSDELELVDEVSREKFLVALSHFQYREDQEAEYRQFDEALKRVDYPNHILLHGHTHQNEVFQYENSLHLGLDANKLMPWNEQEIVDLIKFLKFNEMSETVEKIL